MTIHNNNHPYWMMYSAGYCSWCDKAKALLEEHGIFPDVVDVTEQGNLDEFRMTGHKTIPQVYRNGTLIGGFNALEQWLAENSLPIFMIPKTPYGDSGAPAYWRD